MSKRVQARKQFKAMPQLESAKDEKIERMQQNIDELQQEIINLKISMEEEKIFQRDQQLIRNLHELRRRKQEGVLNKILKIAFNR